MLGSFSGGLSPCGLSWAAELAATARNEQRPRKFICEPIIGRQTTQTTQRLCCFSPGPGALFEERARLLRGQRAAEEGDSAGESGIATGGEVGSRGQEGLVRRDATLFETD